MSSTPSLGLPLIASGQAQKHVTLNEALLRLDSLVQLSVISATLPSQPSNPSPSDVYILPAGASGSEWATFQAGDLAVFEDDGWAAIAPQRGWRAFIQDEDVAYQYTSLGWAHEVSATTETLQLGINTTSNTTQRLAVKSDTELLSHDDITPGSGDARKLINKQALEKTASLLFQNGYSGRAELGLLGNDDLSFQVSPDGTSFSPAFKVHHQTGNLELGSDKSLGFSYTHQGTDFTANISASSGGFAFSKPSSDVNLSDGTLFLFQNVGGQNSGNPFWQGVHYSCSSVTDQGQTVYPRFSMFWSYTNKDDPTDLTFALRVSNVGSLPAGLRFESENQGTIRFLGGRVKIGDSEIAPTTQLHVDGLIRTDPVLLAALPSAISAGAGAIAFVSDAADGAQPAYSDGAQWRRFRDGAVLN